MASKSRAVEKLSIEPALTENLAHRRQRRHGIRKRDDISGNASFQAVTHRAASQGVKKLSGRATK